MTFFVEFFHLDPFKVFYRKQISFKKNKTKKITLRHKIRYPALYFFYRTKRIKGVDERANDYVRVTIFHTAFSNIRRQT